jgi:murein L,D-transpeptidase YafK
MSVVLRFALLAPVLLGLGGCLNFLGLGGTEDSVAPADRQLPASTQALLAIKGMKQESPIFVRIFKEESELEVWKYKDGRFQYFRTYPICAWSGGLGPKVQQGDRQAPEGFYTISRGQMNPHSLYHLAFNIGFPNAYDRSNGHTGSALMIHGNCKSAGCYAMTDAYIEEIYILAREAFNAGQTKFHVQALPFRMTADNMQRHRDSPWYQFWVSLKEGYDAFEATGKPPIVKVCSKQYLVNVSFPGGDPDPDGQCPKYSKIDLAQMTGIDGVPPTVMANLSKPDAPKHAAVPAVMTASMQSADPKPTASTQTAAVDISASPVITRQAPKPAVASLPPKAPAIPAYEEASRAAPQQTAQVRASAAQPVNFQVGGSFTASAQAASGNTDAANAAAADPDGVQKLNRTGKGGLLSGNPQTNALSIGTAGAAPQN